VNNLPRLNWALVIFSPEWFTLWVALHLAASDLLPWWKHTSIITGGTASKVSR